MMTVEECIKKNKIMNGKKISRFWLCPHVVFSPKIGANYTCTGSIDSKPQKGSGELEVEKFWREDQTLCMIYKPEGEPITFSV